MKKCFGLLVVCLLSVSIRAGDFCSEIDYFFQQLTINCRNISGRLIPSIKEHSTTRVISGMLNGQCSGMQAYSSDFVKFFSLKFEETRAADSLFQQFKARIDSCLAMEGFVIQSQADIDDGDKIVRWGKTVSKKTQTVALDLKPDSDKGFVVTLELILSYL